MQMVQLICTKEGKMTSEVREKLLKNKKVLEEISRHRWIESEKTGQDIGFDKAATDWLENFSQAWMQYHMPKKKRPSARHAKTHKASTADKHAKRRRASTKQA